MPSLFPFRTMRETSTPCLRSSAMQASPIRFGGIRLTKAASIPKRASPTATFASPPPKVASSDGLWKNLSLPGAFSLSMISPKVMIFFIGILYPFCRRWIANPAIS